MEANNNLQNQINCVVRNVRQNLNDSKNKEEIKRNENNKNKSVKRNLNEINSIKEENTNNNLNVIYSNNGEKNFVNHETKLILQKIEHNKTLIELKTNYIRLVKMAKGLLLRMLKFKEGLLGKLAAINQHYDEYSNEMKNRINEFKISLKNCVKHEKNLILAIKLGSELSNSNDYEMAKENLKKIAEAYRKLNKNYNDIKVEAEIF